MVFVLPNRFPGTGEFRQPKSQDTGRNGGRLQGIAFAIRHFFHEARVKGSDPVTSNEENDDEALANPIRDYPDPLTPLYGKPVRNAYQWGDSMGMLLAAVKAGPVYELLGKKGLEQQEMLPSGTALTEGNLGFRQHPGGHNAAPNWPVFIAFVKKFLKK